VGIYWRLIRRCLPTRAATSASVPALRDFELRIRSNMDVTFLGMGFVGCVTAACLADRGHNVTGVDLDESKVSLLNAGNSPIIEPGLSEIIERVVTAGRLRALTNAH